MRTRLDHATVVTPAGDAVAVHDDHTIEFKNERITWLGPTAAAAERPPADETVDASRYLVIPGLVNTHHHLFQSITRCRKSVQDATLFDWLVGQYPIWRHLDYDTLKLAATISLAELLLSGGTTTSDHHYLFPRGNNVRLEAVLEAADALG
ncbi:MAG: amidohydrolase family protein, partial [Phycisphaerae bacterium]